MDGVDAFVLSHPSNPVGWLLDVGGFEGFLERAFAQPNSPWVVVDEAFVDFCPEGSLKGLLGRFPSLILLRSLTKFYAIPGLRVGALLAEPSLAKGLRGSLPPWPLNTIAIEASLATLQDFEYPLRLRVFIKWMRELYLERLGGFFGVSVFPSQTNYVLAEIPELEGRLGAFEGVLRGYGVKVRVRLPGLSESFVRIAIKCPDALDALEAALSGFLRSGFRA
jgi:threonine-phosphate decarboxylase